MTRLEWQAVIYSTLIAGTIAGGGLYLGWIFK